MLSLRRTTRCVTSLYVTVLVDWQQAKQVAKLEKRLGKAIKKHSSVSEINSSRINTFLVVSAELREEPTLDQRVAAEQQIKRVLRDYADKLNQRYRKELVYNGDSDIYHDAFAAVNLPLKQVFDNRRHGLLDDFEEQVSKIISTASIMIWDSEGYDHDRIILPELVATMDEKVEVQPATIPAITDLIDELIIANFADYFLPFVDNLLHHAQIAMDQLTVVMDQDPKFGQLSVDVERALRNFIGSISGMQESLKLLRREVSRLCQVLQDIEEEMMNYPSKELQQWLQRLQTIDCIAILDQVDMVHQTIANVKPKLRMLLKQSTKGEDQLSKLFHPMIEIKAVSSALVEFTHRFNDIPSFTTLSNGIAFEQVENEQYRDPQPGSLLDLTKVFKLYNRGSSTVYALRGVDLTIEEGEFVIIEGPSGAGKTTLLNLMAGLDEADRGAVYFRGQNLLEMNERQRSKIRRQYFSFIFQNYALISHLTAQENVQLPIEMAGLSSELYDEIQPLLEEIGIGDYVDHKPAHLSGGQMQRLGIARALASQPKIIFADEPTGDLDSKTGETVMQLLKRYHEQTGVTIVLVTHNSDVARYGTRVIKVEDGQIR